MQRIVPSLWFDDNAEEAVNFYISVFKNSKIEKVVRYSEKGPGKPGSVMSITFKLEGEDFFAINGGPHFTFTPAVSFLVNCNTQHEVDYLWEKLSEGGSKEQCGWLRDKYGLSWQVVPLDLGVMMSSGETEKVQRVTEAMLKMQKLDIAKLKEAYEAGNK